MKMGKTSNDEAYERGVNRGLDGGFGEDFSEDISRQLSPIEKTEKEKIEAKGYEWGRDHRDSDDSSGSSSSDDSCCYITTACLKSLRMPEDSLEFKAMKTLTKEYILKSRQGKRDYVSYGRKSPAIVKRIEARTDAREIWTGVYEKLKGVAKLVLNKNYEGGYQSYRSLVIDLNERF